MTTDESRAAGDGEGGGQAGVEEPAGSTPTGPPRDRAPGDRPPEGDGSEEVPLGQRIYDSPFLLLVAGIVIMLVFYTGWGLWEIVTLPEAPLP